VALAAGAHWGRRSAEKNSEEQQKHVGRVHGSQPGWTHRKSVVRHLENAPWGPSVSRPQLKDGLVRAGEANPQGQSRWPPDLRVQPT